MVVPPKHPEMIIFSRKNPWVVVYHHFRNPPYVFVVLPPEFAEIPSQRAMQKLNLAHDGIARQLHQQEGAVFEKPQACTVASHKLEPP